MRSHKPRRSFSLYVWHRYVGLTALLLVLVLATTGIALNHTDGLNLSENKVNSEWLLDWYGIAPAADFRAFPLGPRWLVETDGHLFLDHDYLFSDLGTLLGAVGIGDMIVAATRQNLVLLTTDGQLIDRMDGTHGVPAGLSAIGISGEGDLVVRASHGIYRTDENLLEWRHPDNGLNIEWVEAGNPPAGLTESLAELARHHVLDWERVTLDLHSGRILGRQGPLLMDLAALLLVFLSVSGFWLWLRQKRKMQFHHKKRG